MSRHVGHVPVHEGRILYTSRIDPHLTFGAEVVVDIANTALRQLETVQVLYLHRLLCVNSCSCIAPLFTETGLWPLRYRRLDLPLRYLLHILSPSPSLFVRLAFEECTRLHSTQKASWIGDLTHTLERLPVPVSLPSTNLTPDTVTHVRNNLQKAMAFSPQTVSPTRRNLSFFNTGLNEMTRAA
ncbi:hypothetical protein M422DRAFT_270305 [Sphaerobolus stellatus SS14]|uniref:Uncharacterized protein n=1 Tax=Sphaerobolus stellatus (strain SS14) TaxID=990650 RepID=A0A0C9UHN9_SPHS4|nr:hypothetical protein M422DRAFT_270305 [Sphaerobolus stellatus SS14]